MPKIKDTFSDKNISNKSNKSTILSKPAGRYCVKPRMERSGMRGIGINQNSGARRAM